MDNLHISLTEFRNESRVLKQVSSISALPVVEHIYIAALHSDGLENDEVIQEKIILKRFSLKTRGLGKGIFFQLIKYVEFFARVALFYHGKNVRMVNVHTLGLLPLGYFLKLLYRAKLVYDTHELETETNDSVGVRKRLSKIVERMLIRNVDQVFVVSENIADWYRKEYNIVRPTVVFNAPVFQLAEKSNYFKKQFGLRENQLVLLYQGGLSPGRGVELLLEVFSQRADDQVVVVFMGYGELASQIQQLAGYYETIFFHHAVPPGELMKYTMSADVGVSLIENTCLSYYYCMPNKLFEYAMAGLPVFVSNMKEMREFVEKYDMGWVIYDDSIDSTNKAIDQVLTLDLDRYKQNAHTAFLENSWEQQEKKMMAEYSQLLTIK